MIVVLLSLPVSIAACTSGTAAYQMLQDAMKDHITNVDHRPVDSVACTPHVDSVSQGERAALRCLVRFHNGSSYTANAAIQDQNTGGAHNLGDEYSWESPPA
jgi:hypothetical protein